jgi:hypothetical protein
MGPRNLAASVSPLPAEPLPATEPAIDHSLAYPDWQGVLVGTVRGSHRRRARLSAERAVRALLERRSPNPRA